MTFTTIKGLVLAAAAAGFVALSPVGASAAPINPGAIAAGQTADVTQVHWRGGYGHRGWGYGGGWHRRHHGWYGYGRPQYRAYGYYPRRSYYY